MALVNAGVPFSGFACFIACFSNFLLFATSLRKPFVSNVSSRRSLSASKVANLCSFGFSLFISLIIDLSRFILFISLDTSNLLILGSKVSSSICSSG